MTNRSAEFESVVLLYFRLHSDIGRFNSAENVKAITAKMLSYGLGVPSDTMVKLAIADLVAEGSIARADGGTDATDEVAARATEKARIAIIASRPLTRFEFEDFASLSQSVLTSRYYSDPEFKIRYDVGIRQYGFNKPLPPEGPPTPVVYDTDIEGHLNVEQYHQMRAIEVTRRYRDPKQSKFKRDVDRLIAKGLI